MKTTKNDRRAVSRVTQVCREERAGSCAGLEHRFRCVRSGGATSFAGFACTRLCTRTGSTSGLGLLFFILLLLLFVFFTLGYSHFPKTWET